jgi:hypothetical protein
MTKYDGPSKRDRTMTRPRPISLSDRKRPKSKRQTKGFENNAQMIAKRQGVSVERARAILAAGARRASPMAKRNNPALKKVKGKAKK